MKKINFLQIDSIDAILEMSWERQIDRSNYQISCLPVCQTYCTQTYVLAANNNQCTGMKNRQTKSEVTAIQTNNTENAYNNTIKIFI